MKKTGGGDSANMEALSTQPSSQTSAAPNGTPAARHYPLNLPDAPFHRYEHRMTARDIMVHRIMTDYMNPIRVKPSTYDSAVVHPAAFSPISYQDKELGTDLRCLQKMLFTSYGDAPPPRASPMTAVLPHPHAACCGMRPQVTIVEGPRNRPPLLRDQILDLVRQHYLEADNAILRAWISHLGPVPTPSNGPR
ncbi:hypothetical protein B0T14DRAFT_138565 [Immersiella caudata]|uniref:Uncharacterized protein n=1 Tax=Immersiella caudata TaxID=314043 RepID=A0AA39X5A9_9PEZI|nr:hypothetical protein B0T14DRAFT_138565 [Immersiella caudata]